MDTAAWQPISAEQLQIGHFVRIGDRWFDHPFLQSRFSIESAEELALIRTAGLSRLFIDPLRSKAPDHLAPESSPALRSDSGNAAAASIADPTVTSELAEVVASAARLKSRKATHTADVRRTRVNLLKSRTDYLTAVEDTLSTFALLAAGDSNALDATRLSVRSVLALAAGRERPLTLAPAAAPVGAARLQASLARDAAALAAAVGRRLHLDAVELQTLTMAAMLHAVGLARIPPTLRDETRLVARDELRVFRQYPRLGADLLRECGDFPPEVIRLVLEHRERLDGSGFPAGNSGTSIHPLALVIGAIREYQLRAYGAETSQPARALAHLYRHLRGAYGQGAVEQVIAALSVYPPGTFVALADGNIARVMRVNDSARLAPIVSLYDESLAASDSELIDLATFGQTTIERVLAPASLPSGVLDYFGGHWAGLTFPATVAPMLGARPPRL